MGRIRAARRVIDLVFLDSPLYRCEALEPALGCAISIKLETTNPVRSFKGRGTEVVAPDAQILVNETPTSQAVLMRLQSTKAQAHQEDLGTPHCNSTTSCKTVRRV